MGVAPTIILLLHALTLTKMHRGGDKVNLLYLQRKLSCLLPTILVQWELVAKKQQHVQQQCVVRDGFSVIFVLFLKINSKL